MREKQYLPAPLGMIRSLTRELDRLFEEPGWPIFRPRTFDEPAAWAPDLDVFEKDGTLIARLDLPGLKREDVTVEVTDGRLLITGERKREVEEKQDAWYRSEREFGAFYRAIPLPETAMQDEVKATFVDGVLEVIVPLAVATAATPRKVAIEEPPKAVKKVAA
jgi:HSP20 family protein